MEENKKPTSEEEALKNIAGENARMITIDEEFDFECQQCGQCCMHRKDIILNPWDVYQIAKHEHMSCADVIEKYCICDLGANSRLPMVLLNCDMGKHHRCPFLELDYTNGCKYKCRIHDCSPGACQNHPIGTMFSYKMGEDGTEAKVQETKYCKVEQCDNSKGHNHMVSVREWTKRYTDNIKEISLAHKIQTLCSQYFNVAEYMVIISYLDRKIIHENEQGNASEEEAPRLQEMSGMCNGVYSMLVNGTISVGYAKYDASKPFIEQAEANIIELQEMYQVIKEAVDGFKKILEIPEDADVKEFILKDSVESGLIDETRIPKEILDVVKEKIKEGDI